MYLMNLGIGQYKPSFKTIDKFSRSNFAIIAGPAAAGKDTLRNELLNLYPETYKRIVSLTDRPPRKNEIDGQDYYFVSKEQITDKANSKSLIQLANVHSQQLSALDSVELGKISEGQIGLSILIVQTQKELAKINQNIKTVFLIPPTIEEMLARLKVNRPNDSSETARRLSAAKKEIEIALDEPDYYCLVSEDQHKNAIVANDFLLNNIKDKNMDLSARNVMREIVGKL